MSLTPEEMYDRKSDSSEDNDRKEQSSDGQHVLNGCRSVMYRRGFGDVIPTIHVERAKLVRIVRIEVSYWHRSLL